MNRTIEDESDPLYGEILKNLRDSRSDLIYGYKTGNHICSNKECFPKVMDPMCICVNMVLFIYAVLLDANITQGHKIRHAQLPVL